MKKKFLLTLLSLIVLVKITVAQTSVSGGIYSNTTWTLANSPYLITNNIVVFPGVTLTIEPGVEVLVMENGMSGTQYYIETRGQINMVGTPEAPITFRSETAPTTVGAWAGIKIKNSQGGSINYNYVNMSNAVSCFDYDGTMPSLIQLNQCNFSYNGNAVLVGTDIIAEDCIFIGNDMAVYGWSGFTFNNCKFDGNQTALLLYASSLNMNNCELRNNNSGLVLNSISVEGTSVTNTIFENNEIAYNNANGGLIDSCIFIGNTEALINTYDLTVSNSTFSENTTALQVGFGTVVTDCEIEQNQTGLALGPISFGQTAPIIENNRVCFNELYNIDNRTDLNLFIPSNCFCTTDSTEIEEKIFDGYDDITKGLISYAIFDTTCINLLRLVNKTLVPTSIEENGIQESIQIYPNPATDYLILTNNTAFNTCTIRSIEGKEISNERLSIGSTTLDLTQLPAGIYFAELQATGKQNQILKFVRSNGY
jgi:hypothetical protein